MSESLKSFRECRVVGRYKKKNVVKSALTQLTYTHTYILVRRLLLDRKCVVPSNSSFFYRSFSVAEHHEQTNHVRSSGTYDIGSMRASRSQDERKINKMNPRKKLRKKKEMRDNFFLSCRQGRIILEASIGCNLGPLKLFQSNDFLLCVCVLMMKNCFLLRLC